MAYRIKGKNGLPIKKDGNFLMGFDIPTTKIEQMNEVELSFLAVGSTEDEDRDKDIVRVSGWKLDNFKNNPVLTWSHNYWEPPVGKAVSIKKDNNKKKLIFKAQFDKDDDKARLIFNKYKNGFLNTFSVGFIGLEFNFRDEENRWFGGKEFVKQELLEISPVTVPANPNANMDIRGMGDDLPPNLVQMGFKQFTCNTDSGLFVPVADTEIYTAPFTVAQENGIKCMYASVVGDESTEKELVGYVFTSEVSEEEANEWVKAHNKGKAKIKYYDMSGKSLGDFEFDLEIVEEEVKAQEEETIESSVVEDVEEVKELEEDSTVEETEEGLEVDEEETEEDAGGEEEENLDDEDKNVGDDLEEKTTEVVEFKLSEDQLNYIVEEVKKAIVNDQKMDNNDDNDSAIELTEETEASKSGDIIEFDTSLFPPVSEEKNSEDTIEIDEKVFDEVKSQIKDKSLGKSVSVGLREVLEKSIKTALSDFSGKLED